MRSIKKPLLLFSLLAIAFIILVSYLSTQFNELHKPNTSLQNAPTASTPHRALTRDDPDVLKDTTTTTTTTTTTPPAAPPSSHDDSDEKTPLLQKLTKTGVIVDDTLLQKLPTATDITKLYGPGPRVAGLAVCAGFRKRNKTGRTVITDGGLFHTGTTLLTRLLEGNCDGVPVVNNPWWKHSPASLSHATEHVFHKKFHEDLKDFVGGDGDYEKNVLQVVMIKDPFNWIVNMCHRRYSTNWKATREACPNLHPEHRPDGSIEAPKLDFWKRNRGKYLEGHEWDEIVLKYHSIIHLWNNWNREQLESEHPNIMVRFEDLVFNTEHVIEQVCRCAGGTMKETFTYFSEPAKSAPGAAATTTTAGNWLAEAMVRYGKDSLRTTGFTKSDMQFALQNLNMNMMQRFHYVLPSYEEG